MAVRFAPSAKRFLVLQPPETASKLIDDCVELAAHPEVRPDDLSRGFFDAPPAVMRIYRDDLHWVIYYLERGDLVVANVGSVLERPHLFRPEPR